MRIKKAGKFLSLTTLLVILLLTLSCDEKQVKTLGSTVGLRGQDVGNSAVMALQKIVQYQDVDLRRRRKMQILVLPPEALNASPAALAPRLTVTPLRFDDALINNRIELYKQLSKAYRALQELSDGNFGEDSSEAVTAFNTSLSKIKAAPQIPANVSSLLSGLTGFIVNKKQAGDIRRVNLNLYRLVKAHRGLWESDRPVWTDYFRRVKGAYINNLRSLPAERFDRDKLEKEVNEPFPPAYLVQLYKNQEEAKVDDEINVLQGYINKVNAAFVQLEKGHIELAKQTPSYLDAIAELDSIVTIVEPIFLNK